MILEKIPAITVASVPPMISTGPKLSGFIRFDTRHPTASPGIMLNEKIGNTVIASDILACTGPYEIGARKYVSTI